MGSAPVWIVYQLIITQSSASIAAILRYPLDAQRFIDTFLPQENKDRFYIKRLSQCEGEFA